MGVREDQGAGDLREAAQSAYLTGRRDEAVDLYQRAFRLCEDDGDHAGGVACAFHLSMIFGTSGEPALSSGWTTRAERLVDELGPDVGRGRVRVVPADVPAPRRGRLGRRGRDGRSDRRCRPSPR